MTQKEFLNAIANGQEDILQLFLDILNENEIDYCVIGGLAVNAYVEPVVSLDLDLVIAANSLDKIRELTRKMFSVKQYEQSLNLKSPKSDIRIQLQTDFRYQTFISKAENKQVMGYDMKVAALEDVLQGKLWAYSDIKRRKSKRQKDLADIYRLVEAYPHLQNLLPESL